MFCFVQLQDISADTVLEAFQAWTCSACSEEDPLLLCSGMLLTFDVPEGRHCSSDALNYDESKKVGVLLPYQGELCLTVPYPIHGVSHIFFEI